MFFTFVMILGAAKESDLNPINTMIDIQFPLIYLNLIMRLSSLHSIRNIAMSDDLLPLEVKCPGCKHTEIIYVQKENMPKCPKCDIRMVIKEVLVEGKSY